jgi:hypothetical protein
VLDPELPVCEEVASDVRLPEALDSVLVGTSEDAVPDSDVTPPEPLDSEIIVEVKDPVEPDPVLVE